MRFPMKQVVMHITKWLFEHAFSGLRYAFMANQQYITYMKAHLANSNAHLIPRITEFYYTDIVYDVINIQGSTTPKV